MKNLSIVLDILDLASLYYNQHKQWPTRVYKDVIERWAIGRNEKKKNEQSAFLELADDEKYELIIKKAIILKKKLSPDSLCILFKDIEEVMKISDSLSEKQTDLLRHIKSCWQKELEGYEHDSSHFGQSFRLTNHFGIGFLFYIAIKSDGNVDKSELLQVKRNLESWDNKTARTIIESLNFAENAIGRGSFLNTFSLSDPTMDLAQQEYELLNRVLEYLKEETTISLRVFIFKQIMAILKADGQITASERSIRELLLSSWQDIQGSI